MNPIDAVISGGRTVQRGRPEIPNTIHLVTPLSPQHFPRVHFLFGSSSTQAECSDIFVLCLARHVMSSSSYLTRIFTQRHNIPQVAIQPPQNEPDRHQPGQRGHGQYARNIFRLHTYGSRLNLCSVVFCVPWPKNHLMSRKYHAFFIFSCTDSHNSTKYHSSMQCEVWSKHVEIVFNFHTELPEHCHQSPSVAPVRLGIAPSTVCNLLLSSGKLRTEAFKLSCNRAQLCVMRPREK